MKQILILVFSLLIGFLIWGITSIVTEASNILSNLNNNILSSKLHCGLKKVNDILDGKLLVNESIIGEIAYEFDANDYEDLKKKINQ